MKGVEIAALAGIAALGVACGRNDDLPSPAQVASGNNKDGKDVPKPHVISVPVDHLQPDVVAQAASAGKNLKVEVISPPDLSIKFFPENKFLPGQIVDIRMGINEAIRSWETRGVNLNGLRGRGFVVYSADYNGSRTDVNSGNVILDLASKDHKIAAHETLHSFGVRVVGLPGFEEGFATFGSVLLYGGSADSDKSVDIKKLGGFSCNGNHFVHDFGPNRAAYVGNYDKAALAARALGVDFWTFVTNKQLQWVKDSGFQPWKEVTPVQFGVWVNELKPGLWDQMKVEYPVLFCAP